MNRNKHSQSTGCSRHERDSSPVPTCRDQDSKVYSLQLPFKPEPEKIAAQQAAAGAGALPPGIPPPPNFSGGPPPLPPQGPAPPPQFNPVSPWPFCAVRLAPVNQVLVLLTCHATSPSTFGALTVCLATCLVPRIISLVCLCSVCLHTSLLCILADIV